MFTQSAPPAGQPTGIRPVTLCLISRVLHWGVLLALGLALGRAAAAQTAPTIVSTAPVMNATGVSPSAPVVITFSAAMDTNATTAEFFDLVNMTAPLPIVTAWNAAHTQLTCTPSPAFPVNKMIIFSVTGTDVAGLDLDGNTGGLFTTGTGGPSIVLVSPANQAINVAPNTAVIFTFSAAMNTNTAVVRFFDAMQPTTPIPVSAVWRSDKLQLTCTPTAPFPAGANIMWSVTGTDFAGRALEGGSGVFMTAGTTPMLLGSVPADLATGVATNTAVVFTFSVAMDPAQTAAGFRNTFAPFNPIGFTTAWNAARTQLTCTPAPGFPPGTSIEWTVNGRDAASNAIPTAFGQFATAGTPGAPPPTVASLVLSRGHLAWQSGSNQFETVGPEFRALATANLADGVLVTAPAPGKTNSLAAADWPGILEFSDTSVSTAAFATNYPAGDYRAAVFFSANYVAAALSLADGSQPATPLLLNWGAAPYAVLGQDCLLQWDFAPGGAAVHHVQVRVEKGGAVVFASPPVGQPGALAGAAGSLTVPAAVFTNAGRAEVTLTAFSFIATNTNSIAGVKLLAARHRTTEFSLRVVDGTRLPPRLLSSSVTNLPAGEEILNPLQITNGVRPFSFTLTGGALPTGLTLEPWGALSGQASNAGSYSATMRITDLLGRSSTQTLQITTVALPPDATPPRLENMNRDSATMMRFDLVGPPGVERIIDRSQNLLDWSPLITTNPANQRLTVRTPMDQRAAFYRVRAPIPVLPPPRPLNVIPVVNTNLAVAGQLDEFGGLLQLTNAAGYVFSLNVPPGALDRRETISMTDISRIDGLPLSGGLRAAVDLKPDGLMFNEPARLDITYPTTPDRTRVLGFGARPGGGHFALQPSFVTNRTVSLYLWHFSPAGAGDGSAGDAGGQSANAPDDPMSAMAQQVAAALAACRADPACAEDPSKTMAGLLDIYIRMADQVIIPKLDQAIANDAVLDDAIRTWLRWLKDLALLGLHDGDFAGNGGNNAELNKRVVRAYNKAVKAIKNGMKKACDDCMNHKIERIYRMLELARWCELLGISGSHLEQVEACATKCLVFEIQIESEIVGSDGSAIYSTHTKGKAKLRPQTLGDSDSGTVFLQRMKLTFTGSGSWDITDLQHTVPAECSMQVASKAGRVEVPWASIQLYQKRETYVPGQGAVTSYVFNPDMTLKLRSGLQIMPKEGRVMNCPKAKPAEVPDIFGHTFHAFHNDEVEIPQGVAEEVMGGPVFNITGFTPGGPEDVILSKPYFRTISVATENTLIDLRHTPGK